MRLSKIPSAKRRTGRLQVLAHGRGQHAPPCASRQPLQMIGSSVNVAEFFYVPFRVRHPDWTGADVFGSFDYGPALLLTPFPSAKPGSGHNVDHNWLGEAAERVGDRLSLLVVIDSRTLL